MATSVREASLHTPQTSVLPDEPAPMGRIHKALNVVVVVGPFLGFLAALALFWNDFVGWTNLSILAVGYALTGFGVTVGFHRLLTHRSFKTYAPLRAFWAILGSAAAEGPVIDWVATHRKHHKFSDGPDDVHSPLRYASRWRGLESCSRAG